jgi:hypothetical protein
MGFVSLLTGFVLAPIGFGSMQMSKTTRAGSRLRSYRAEEQTSSFAFPCSIFDILSGSMASLLFSNYRVLSAGLHKQIFAPEPAQAPASSAIS